MGLWKGWRPWRRPGRGSGPHSVLPASRRAKRQPADIWSLRPPPARWRGGAHSCLSAGCQVRCPNSPPLTGAGTLAGLGTRRAGGRPHPQNPTQTRSRKVCREQEAGAGGLSPARLQEPPCPRAASPGQGRGRRPCSLSGGGSSRKVDVACTVKHLLRQGPPGRKAGGQTQGPGQACHCHLPSLRGPLSSALLPRGVRGRLLALPPDPWAPSGGLWSELWSAGCVLPRQGSGWGFRRGPGLRMRGRRVAPRRDPTPGVDRIGFLHLVARGLSATSRGSGKPSLFSSAHSFRDT